MKARPRPAICSIVKTLLFFAFLFYFYFIFNSPFFGFGKIYVLTSAVFISLFFVSLSLMVGGQWGAARRLRVAVVPAGRPAVLPRHHGLRGGPPAGGGRSGAAGPRLGAGPPSSPFHM